MKRAGQWITWVSVVVLVGSMVGGIALTVSGFGAILGSGSNAIALSGPGNSVEHDFEAGQEWQLFTYGANGVYVGPTPECEIDGPAPVEPGTAIRTSITIGAESRISFASIVFTASGSYRVACDQAGVTMAPVGAYSGGFLASFGGMALLIGGAALGITGLVIGILLWVVGANRRRGAAPPSPPSPGPLI